MKERKPDISVDDTPSRNGTSSEQGELEGAAGAMRRITDYIGQSLAKPDGLEANLGAVNAKLMLMALRMSEVLDEALTRDPEETMTGDRFGEVIDRVLRVHKQIDRYSQLEIKLRGLKES